MRPANPASVDDPSEQPLTRAQLGAQIRYSAMNLLARREHSAQELQQKLARRFDDSQLIGEVVRTLAQENLQSEERFAEAFVNARIAQGKGPVRIELELQQRGISAELIASSLEAVAEGWQDLIGQVRDKRFGAAPADSPREKARQIRFLQYRGFTSDQIRRLLD